MYLGRIETAFAIPMLAAAAASAATWVWGFASEPRAPGGRRTAVWMTLPAAQLSAAGVVVMLICFTLGRAHPMVQYNAGNILGSCWVWWFLFAFFALPAAALVALLSFLAAARGWRLFAVRAIALIATGLVWCGTVANFPDA